MLRNGSTAIFFSVGTGFSQRGANRHASTPISKSKLAARAAMLHARPREPSGRDATEIL